jgi:uncharacterized protein (TIGR02246 family)
MPGRSDEDQIREFVTTWMEASRAGDQSTVLSLMTDDAVFLVPGRPPMGKADFAAAANPPPQAPPPRVDGHSEIQEIKVLGDWAFMWTRLAVVISPSDGSPSTERRGHTLSILRRENGRWLLARDANLLAPVAGR